MLKVALLLQNAIKKYFITYKKVKIKWDRLNIEEWRILDEIKSFLGILKLSTKFFESYEASFDQVFPLINFIFTHFKKAKEKYKDNVKISAMINLGWQKIDKYYGKSDEFLAYAAALLLNPACKWLYIE